MRVDDKRPNNWAKYELRKETNKNISLEQQIKISMKTWVFAVLTKLPQNLFLFSDLRECNICKVLPSLFWEILLSWTDSKGAVQVTVNLSGLFCHQTQISVVLSTLHLNDRWLHPPPHIAWLPPAWPLRMTAIKRPPKHTPSEQQQALKL